MPRKVLGRDGDKVLVDLDRTWQPGDVPVPLGATVADDGTVSPALPVVAFAESGLYDQPVEDPEEVLGKVGEPPDGLP